MIKEEKSPEMTRQFDNIWEEHHDPRLVEIRRRKIEREKRRKEKEEDLGL